MLSEIDFALAQPNKAEQIELVGTVLWNKANKLGSFKKLSLAERNFVFIDIFESEINNGGIFHFFYNTSGEFAHEILDAFNAINAYESALCFDKALRSFPELPVPKDIIIRRHFMNTLNLNIQEKWSQIEDELITSKENIIDLLLAYIKVHKSDFEY